MAKEKLDYDFSSWCNLRLKFGKITSGITLTEESGCRILKENETDISKETEHDLYSLYFVSDVTDQKTIG